MVAFCIARVAAHSIWINPPSHKIASVPRHREIINQEALRGTWKESKLYRSIPQRLLLLKFQCARTQRVLLLFAAVDRPGALPRLCRTASAEGQQFVPQHRFLLRRMQRTERRNPGRGFSALALPRRAFDGRRTHWTAAGGRSACGRQTPASVAQSECFRGPSGLRMN